MARINIENDLYTRGEWFNLVIAVGSPDTAIGSLVRAWTVAQRYWFPCRQFIPNDVWKRETLNEAMIEAGLAQRTDEGVYVNGCEEQFEWLFIAQEKGKKGGERSAESKKNKAEKVREESNHRSTTGVPQVEILAKR